MEQSSTWRERMLAQLERALPLSVLHGGPGIGKTTALRAWADEFRAAGHPVLWLSLTPDVTCTEDAWPGLVDEARRLGASESTLKALSDSTSRGARLAASRRLAHDLPGLKVAIDRCEFITQDPVPFWQTLAFVAALHSGSSLAASTRHLPEEALQALRFDPAAQLLSDADLAPTQEELLEMAGPRAATFGDAGALVDLRDSARGNLRLVAAHLDAPSPTAEATADALQVLRGRDAERDIASLASADLVRTLSALPWFDTTVAAIMTGYDPDQVAHQLGMLEHLGLCRRTRPTPDAPRVWTEAARLTRHLSHPGPPQSDGGRLAAVIDHYDAAGDTPTALVVALQRHHLETAARLHQRLLVTDPSSLPENLGQLLNALPSGRLAQVPSLAAARGLELLTNPATRAAADSFIRPFTDRGLHAQAARDEQHVHSVDTGTPGDTSTPHPEEHLLGLTAQTIMLSELGHVKAAAHTALEARRLLDGYGHDHSISDSVIAASACHLSRALYEDTRYDEAATLISLGLASAPPHYVRACAVRGRLWYGGQGKMAEAAAMDALAREASGPQVSLDVNATPRTAIYDRVGRALLHMEAHDFPAAVRLLQSSDEHSPVLWDNDDDSIRWIRAALSLSDRTFTETATRFTTELESGPLPQNSFAVQLSGLLAIMWCASGQVARARSVMELYPEAAGQHATATFVEELLLTGPATALDSLPHLRALPGHTVRTLAALELMAAATALRAGAVDQARASLIETAAIHARHGVRCQVLMIDSTDVMALTDFADELDHPQVGALLAGVTERLPEEIWSSLRPILLTEREAAVLRELQHQPSRQQIAQRLHVSENTVKTQLRSLYRKLEVVDRTAALTRAAEMGLIAAP